MGDFPFGRFPFGNRDDRHRFYERSVFPRDGHRRHYPYRYGLYGAPMVWIHFGQLKYFSRLKAQIVGDGIKSVKMLAEVHNRNPEVVANDVKTMVQKGYLDGYLVLDNERIIDKTTMRDKDYEMMEAERAGTLNLVHCPFCNAKFELINDVGVCPYCNSKITKEMLDKSVKAYNKSDK